MELLLLSTPLYSSALAALGKEFLGIKLQKGTSSETAASARQVIKEVTSCTSQKVLSFDMVLSLVLPSTKGRRL